MQNVFLKVSLVFLLTQNNDISHKIKLKYFLLTYSNRVEMTFSKDVLGFYKKNALS